MRIKTKREFFSQQHGDFEAGRVYEVDSGVAAKWIAMGLAEGCKPIPVLLQTKPEPISIETKPAVFAVETKSSTKKRRVKKNESNYATNL